MPALFKCPNCGGATYRVLKQHRTVECKSCGQSFTFVRAFGEEEPTDPPSRPAKPPD